MFAIEEPGSSDIQRFRRDGFLVVERLIEPAAAARLAARFGPLFRGEFETGLCPDEWNWREGRDAEDLTRQICNAWKSDRHVARTVLHPRVGLWCARLSGWPGARINQDNVLWKPPGARPLAFHQDDSYQQWVVPPELCSCWIALDATSAAGGTIEYVVGSHRWGLAPPAVRFHAPDDYEREMHEAAAQAGVVPEAVRVEVPAGGGVFHHGRTFHGSGTNRTGTPRRALVSHCMSSEARYHPTNVGSVYGRYKRAGTTEMDESFFPVLWTEDGYRSAFLDGYLGAVPDTSG
ncbi:MAG: phytanoyl-CoA dioxygenase family protein [Rhodospirillaceae bacterium]|nr:phytanoyl-CoA dioxygenase family protein [Rhodospirillaceae bacterium]MDE0618759.1 phytanoyl-CoA dioxygenase family protein [Rhodospirillaceae bacterium]